MIPSDARVLLTGATGGIGQAVAEALLKSGASLLLTGRSPARLSAQARELRRHLGVPSARVEWCAADLSLPQSWSQAHGLVPVAADWGVNAVVHAAGVPAFGRLEDQSAEAVAASLQTNLLAPLLLTRALLPHLRTRQQAQVIFIGSALGRIGLPGFSVYSAAKFGLRGAAEALRRELRDSPVRVQYLGPRSTRTAFNAPAVEAYNTATGTACDPPQRVAEALVALLKDEAGERYIGWPERLAVRLNGMVPTWLDPLFDRHRRSLSVPAVRDATAPLNPTLCKE